MGVPAGLSLDDLTPDRQQLSISSSFRGSFFEEDQVSCVVVDNIDGFDTARTLGELKPPAAGPPMNSQSLYSFPPEQLDNLKHSILLGNLHVSVFNKHLQLEPKRLALNHSTRRISILREDGLCEDSWEIDSLRCITEGIDSTILQDPPPADRALAFRFKFKDSDAEDRFLCVVLDAAGTARMAAEAFGQLCGVPIQTAGS